MAQFKSEQAEKDAVIMAAKLMAMSARTAPKGRGIDNTDSLILEGEDLEKLAEAMERKIEGKSERMQAVFARDADNVRNSDAVLLLGVKGYAKGIEDPPNCGACGYLTCEQMTRAKRRGDEFTGPVCLFEALDLGIALGSAVKTASTLNVDNRIMFTAGTAAKAMGLLDSDVVIGIPMSITGKSLYFDRTQNLIPGR